MTRLVACELRAQSGPGEPPSCARSAVCVQAVREMLQVLHDTRGPDGMAPPRAFDTGMDAVPEAVDMAVRLMTPGELSLVHSSGRFAYDRRADRPEVRSSVWTGRKRNAQPASCESKA